MSASQAAASASRPPSSRSSRLPASNGQTEYMSAASAEGPPEQSSQHETSPPRRQPVILDTQQQLPTQQDRRYSGSQQQLVDKLRGVTIESSAGQAQQQPAAPPQPRAMQDGDPAVPDTAADSQHQSVGRTSSHRQPASQQQPAASGMSGEYNSAVCHGNTSGSVRSHMTAVTETPLGLEADLTGYTLDQMR